jgi:hypothetical protein
MGWLWLSLGDWIGFDWAWFGATCCAHGWASSQEKGEGEEEEGLLAGVCGWVACGAVGSWYVVDVVVTGWWEEVFFFSTFT